MPELPNAHIAIVLGLIALALALFATERVRMKSAALLVFVSTLVVFTAFPFERGDGEPFDPLTLFEAFGNEALVAVCALMVLGKGIQTTRALQPLVAAVSRLWAEHPLGMMLVVMLIAAALSAFMNNTPIVVMLLPALISIARKNGIAPSRLLLPIGFATYIGGMSTTIGTSTNLLVVTLSEDIAGIRFDMFDFSWYVIAAGSVGLLYLGVIAPRIAPDRQTDSGASKAHRFQAVLRIRESSNLAGSTIREMLISCAHALDIDHIETTDGRERAPLPTTVLEAGDYLFVRGDRDALKEAENVLGAPLTDLESPEHKDPDKEPRLAEVLVTGGSELHGRSLKQASLHARFGITAVGLHRANPERPRIHRPPEEVELDVGDILLCQGTNAQFDAVEADTRLLLLQRAAELPMTHRSWAALGIMFLVVATAALGLLPIAISAVAGVGLMIATRCISWRHVGEGLNMQVVLVIVVSLALGQALMATGGDTYLASVFNALLAGVGPFWVVSLLMLFSAILTNIVTNNAAAVITTPIAVQIASQLGMDPEPVVLAVLFGANLCYVTPIVIMWALFSWLLKTQYGLSGEIGEIGGQSP